MATRRDKRAVFARKRLRVLVRSPLCSVCGMRASLEVDHIVPLAKGGSHDESNLRAVCRECHRKATRRAWAPPKVVDSDGWRIPDIADKVKDLARAGGRRRMWRG